MLTIYFIIGVIVAIVNAAILYHREIPLAAISFIALACIVVWPYMLYIQYEAWKNPTV